MSDDIHATVERRLRRTRQRYTTGRRQLVRLLADVPGPLTIAELVATGARQSQSSLYRNLAILEQCGVVRRLVSADDVARYELEEELTGHHHHLVCQVCGTVADLTLPATVERALDRAADAAEDEYDFRIDNHRVELVGACGDCR